MKVSLGDLFLYIVNDFKAIGHLTSASLGSTSSVYFTLTANDGTTYDFSIHKTEAVKND